MQTPCTAEAGSDLQVSFEIADVMTFEAQQPFDVVYSRDTLLHIHDKPALFRRRALLHLLGIQCARLPALPGQPVAQTA